MALVKWVCRIYQFWVLIPIGLQACAAIRKFPAAGDNDHPNEVDAGNNPGSDKRRHEVRTLQAEVVERGEENPHLKQPKADGEDEL